MEEIENTFTGSPYRDLEVKAGDQVLLLLELDQGRLQNVHLDIARDRYIYIDGSFIFTVVLIAGPRESRQFDLGLIICHPALAVALCCRAQSLLLTVLFTSLITCYFGNY